MKKLIIIGPERILNAIKYLVDDIWEADHKYERLDNLECKIEEVEYQKSENGEK